MVDDTNVRTIEIDSTEFLVSRYAVSDQAAFGPRFGSGEPSESDFTLLKTRTFRSRFASCFRPDTDGEMVPRLSLGSVDQTTGVLQGGGLFTRGTTQLVSGNDYSATYASGGTNIDDVYGVYGGGGYWRVTDTVKWEGATLVGLVHGTTAKIVKITSAGVRSEITAPSSFTATSTGGWVSFAAREGVLYATSRTAGMHYLNAGLTTLTKVPSSTGTFQRIFNMNGKMYAIGGGTGWRIYEWTGSPTTYTYTQIDLLKDYADSTTEFMEVAVLNGRAYIRQDDCITVFDGVRASVFLRTNSHFIIEYQGAIYFDDGKYLIRTNGSTIETLFDMAGCVPFAATVHKRKLYFVAYKDQTYIDRFLTLPRDVTNASNGGFPVFEYDGVDMTLYATTNNLGIDSAVTAYSLRIAQLVSAVDGKLYGLVLRNDSGTGKCAIWELAATGNCMRIAFRQDDFDFSSLKKRISRYIFRFDDIAQPLGPGAIKSYFRYLISDQDSSGWTEAYSAADTSDFLEGSDVGFTPQYSNEFLFDVDNVGSTNSADRRLGLLSVGVSYVLLTKYARQWTLTLSPPMSSTDDGSSTIRYAIETLREDEMNTIHVFKDINGTQYNVVIDSLSAAVDVALGIDGTTGNDSVNIVLREVL